MKDVRTRLILWLDESPACIESTMKGICASHGEIFEVLKKLEARHLAIHHPKPSSQPDCFSLSPDGMKLHETLQASEGPDY